MARSDGSQSGGGLLGGIIGATIGFFVGGGIGGAVKGFMYGSTIGGILAPPSGPDIVGPRLEDLSIQTSSNVADLPRFDGTMGMYGNMIWAKENKLQEVITTTTKKKKLLGFTVSKVKTTTYTYYLNCAIAFALMDEEDDCQLLKVWIGDKLVLNRTTDDVGTMLAGLDFDEYFTFYQGKDDQPVDPEIEADVGVGNASAYPGVCYMVIRDLDLSPWGDSAARAQVKVELSSGEVEASDLEFMSQTAATNDPEYVDFYSATFLDVDGLHVWKLETVQEDMETIGDWETADQTFAKYHYVAIPGGGGYLKEKIEGLIPSQYLQGDAVHEAWWLRHASKGKADQNAAVFFTAFAVGAGGGGESGTYPNPMLLGTSVVATFPPPPGCNYPTQYFDSFYEALQFVFTGAASCPGTADSPAYVFDTINQDPTFGSNGQDGINWNDGAGIGEGFTRFTIRTYDPNKPLTLRIPKITEDNYSSPTPYIVTFSVMLVMPGFNKEFRLPAVNGVLPTEAKSFFCLQGDDFYWGYNAEGQGHLYKVGLESGTVINRHSFSDVTNSVYIVRIGIVNDQLCVITQTGTDAGLRIGSLAMGDFTTYTDYDDAAILAAFGFSGQDFIDNCSMDFNQFIYYDGPNVYTKASFAATAVLMGDASPELISGADQPEFFNLWRKGSLLAVSTFGGSLPETGAQFFTVGILGQPGFAQLAAILRKYCLLAGIADSRINTSLINQEVRGHRVAKRGSVRNVIEQLRGCWPFDIVPSGYELKFVPRGTSSVATISHEDLGPDVQWLQDREMTPQIPWRLSLRYLDRDLEYEINEQQSQRPIDSSTEHTLEIPVVFTPDEGAQRVNILHSIFLTERKTFTGFQLPPPYRYLEPADVITVTFPDAIYEVRLATLKTSPSGLIEGEGKPNNVAIYTSTATGSTRVPPVQTIPVAGGEITVLMDLPLISFENAPGFTAVMASVYENWTGGELWRTQDDGGTWDLIQGFEGGGTGGTAANVIGASNGFVVDRVSTLTINMATGSFASVTDEQFYNEEFLVAYGRNGRWEIMACKNAVEDSNGDLIVDTFLRGLRGTEHNTGLHQVGDYFISLNDPDNAFISVATSEIGELLTYRGISKGRDLDSVADSTLQYEAENLTPWSPVNLSAYLDGSDIVFNWKRRDRINSGWNNFFDIPMSEATESYQLYIYDELGVSIIRTLTSTEPTVRYTDDQQTTDFGSGAATEVYASVAQVSAVVGPGHASPVALIVAGSSPYVGAQRWRIANIVNNGHSNTSFVQVTFRDITGAAISVVGATATASSQFSGSFVPANAIDNNTSTRWASNTGTPGQWFEISYPGIVYPFSVDIQNPAAVTGDNINDADIQWYDGTTWITQAQILNETGWGSLEIRNFIIQTQ